VQPVHLGLGILALACAGALVLHPGPRDPDRWIQEADLAYEKKNYREAREGYERALAEAPRHPRAWHAGERVILCSTRLGEWDRGLQAGREMVARHEGGAREARAERLLGNLHLDVPHYGTRSGGEFQRGVWRQGIHLQTHRADKRAALRHLERARELYAEVLSDPARAQDLSEAERAGLPAERLETLLDLAKAAAAFTGYDPSGEWFGRFAAERDDAAALAAGETDFEEEIAAAERDRQRALGLPVNEEGRPVFPRRPAAYDPLLTDDEKILAVLHEVRTLDREGRQDHAARSLHLQAMLARARFGLDDLRRHSWRWFEGEGSAEEAIEDFQPWTLGDAQCLTLVNGRLAVVDLPEDWDVLGLLAALPRTYPDSSLCALAVHTAALYRQSRQQYPQALALFDAVIARWPDSEWAGPARELRERLLRPEVLPADSGVQDPAGGGELHFRFRNTGRVWFTVREIALDGFFRALRAEKPDPDKGNPAVAAMAHWEGLFLDENRRQAYSRRAGDFIGREIGRVSVPVEAHPDHRYALGRAPLGIQRPGVYLVHAYTGEPSPASAAIEGGAARELSSQRALVVLSDLAFIEKTVQAGRIFMAVDARTGAPVAGATLEAIESWSVFDRDGRRNRHFEARYDERTDGDGIALLKRPADRPAAQLHAVLTAPGPEGLRLAWTGMRWSLRRPGRGGLEGPAAWLATDRPVYRPGHTVQVKGWLRRRADSGFAVVAGPLATLKALDPRGNEIAAVACTPDDFGGIEASFVLGREAALGPCQLQVWIGDEMQGGAAFRVEEYKKPEFEVTVKAAKSQARLGESLSIELGAAYYYGAPVTEGTLRYRVFREEYRHWESDGGPWVWLYGEGYGRASYDSPWFHWWRGDLPLGGRYPGGRRARELVMEGESRLGAEGKLTISIDTSSAQRDHRDQDHRYHVVAEVVDASRRRVEGEGSVVVTREAFAASLRAERGFLSPGETIGLELRCRTPNGEGVAARGIVTVAEVDFGQDGNQQMRRRELDRYPLETGEDGRATLSFRPERSGQFEIVFEAPDAWGGIVRGRAVVWSAGADFDGRVHRFNDLELITDRRTYRPGETARVMVNTRVPGSTVLFSTRAEGGVLRNWQVLRIAGRSMVLDFPILEADRPNVFLEAACVRDHALHGQVREVCVPPEEKVLRVELATGKSEYRPGERCEVEILAREADGSPARAQICLAAFDQSLLAIEGRSVAGLLPFFHGLRRAHHAGGSSNLSDRLPTRGSLLHPDLDLVGKTPWPPGWSVLAAREWGGAWGPGAGFRGRVSDDLGAPPERRRGESKALGAEAAAGEAPPAPSAAAPMRQAGRELDAGTSAPASREDGPGGTGSLAVRTRFADTAAWLPSLVTGADGRARASFDMPENLTGWRIEAYAMTASTHVGQAQAHATTKKDFLVRLQAPRFFLERDEVVVSANVHNYLPAAKTANVGIRLGNGLLALAPGVEPEARVQVPAGGEVRVDWRVRVLREGTAEVAVSGVSDRESDAMQMRFPVLVHGALRREAWTAVVRPDEMSSSREFELRIPEERRPELSRIEVRYAPSLAGAMMDALPYCLDYPYGCTEQTMSRFLPAVLTRRVLQDMGVSLEDVRRARGRLAEVRRREQDRRQVVLDSPVFDTATLDGIIADGLSRIASMQNADGGFGWWKADESSPDLTGYVLFALVEAAEADVRVDERLVQSGMQFLEGAMQAAMQRPEWRVTERAAFTAYVLSLRKREAAIKPGAGDDRPGRLLDRLWEGRDRLNLYGKALLSLALDQTGDRERAAVAAQNIVQFARRNEATQVAWFELPGPDWWNWWNSDTEAAAWALRALIRQDARHELGPLLVKGLLENRKNGYYWRSTRDTTICVAAMADFARRSGETDPDCTVRIDLDDGAFTRTVRLDRASLLEAETSFVVEGEALAGGPHRLRVTKDGRGALYLGVALTTFTKEEEIAAAGHQLQVERRYFRLDPVPYEAEVQDARGGRRLERRLRYERVPLASGAEVRSGDLIQVELELSADNHYTYLALEDMKPAGFEALEVRSGTTREEGFWTWRELRDDRTVFFLTALDRGRHLIRYRLRAEIPGSFSALPTQLHAMYAPELRANAAKHRLRIRD
jgi:uncharacterized protein YfaS (alpha-2-macroglobulin family)/tetratricopeptide (TPR) repeat protein